VQDPEIAAQKTSIVDILCTDQEGNTYVVEMQIAQEKGFEKRAQYYAAKAYASQLLVGGKYYDLKEVIFVAIADFIMFPQKEAYKSDHIILDQATHDHDLKDFSFTFLELPKFNKTIDELKTPIENWCYFFKHAPETSEKDISKLSMYPIIERAYEELNRFSWSPEELLTYDQAEKYEGAHQAALDFQFDKGMEKGIEKGLQEGIEKGMEKGIEKGLQEGIEKGKHDVARALLKRGMPLELVAEATGLTKKTLETL
jgi:predicted transposase/invertase (TIGR01784 family)